MKNIFDKIDNAELIARINRLHPASAAQWGKMNVAQMMAHVQVPMMLAFDDIEIKRGLIGLLFGKMAKKQLMSDAPFKKNLPTFRQAKMTGHKDFDIEKEKLKEYVDRFINDRVSLTQRPHPIFGILTLAEMNVLHYKHLDHHLQQFGVW
ncbi:DUF1569 domain-containing protein [Mucilaginibacter myungsuensis]|uniref:DUF1569 domain-containing protein n=1 Tax=Mucilaginibacter myungsuensis TaxID=649104 RepID=A0A929PXK1_9SPHI|nr:DUF1569 domain-containing protein [Mucilaginibacter myungsuensis]MBE9663261.1 DUF1569 domain-containing protein [Mucilaginibacter myungsuensis]MDN3598895.1 DUF1569 domain-containing protein [Mucilaginibacter myungsuensis]